MTSIPNLALSKESFGAPKVNNRAITRFNRFGSIALAEVGLAIETPAKPFPEMAAKLENEGGAGTNPTAK